MYKYDIDLINRFLTNELSEEEAISFKLRYTTKQEFAKEVNIRSRIYISLTAASKLSTRKFADNPFLQQISSNFNKMGHLTQSQKRYDWLYKAAVVLVPLLIIGVILLLITHKKATTDDLFAMYYKTGVEETGSRGDLEFTTYDFTAILNDIDNTVKLSIDTMKSAQEIYSFGLFCMDNNRFQDAIYAFSELLNQGNKNFMEDAEWRLGLCYLKLGKTADAIYLFEQIRRNTKHLYFKRAGDILGQLK